MIDSRIEAHDSSQFELKLDYTLDTSRRHNRYDIEVYFFVPKSLGVTPLTYHRGDFYNDIQGYIRFKTPQLSFRALVDSQAKRSPLYRINAALPFLIRDPGDKARLTRVDEELRMFGCFTRVNLRDRVGALLQRLDVGGVEDVGVSSEILLDELHEAISQFRQLAASFEDTTIPQWLREVYLWVDEYISIMIEAYLTELLARVDGLAQGSCQHASRIRKAVATALTAELKYRSQRQYVTLLSADGRNEHFIYRSGQLKKFVTSVLFLDINKENEGERWLEIAAATAAGIAMLLSTLAAIWSQQRYGLNSWAFVFALVVGYMFKDRIKDWLRRMFAGQLRRFLADFKVDIVDPLHETKVGRCHESFAFLPRARIPDGVWQARHADSTSVIEKESKREYIMCYSKSVRIRGEVIGELHGRLSDINDIIRFNIRRLLNRADDPTRTVPMYEPEVDRVSQIEMHKLYHLNVVFALKVPGKTSRIRRVRVVFDKTGIRRLEELAL